MKKKVLAIIIFSSVSTFAVPNYFPIWQGNTWEFAYHTNSYPIVPSPSITSDSGIVHWKVLEPFFAGGKQVFQVKETRSLYRRIVTRALQTEYDSVFSLPRVSIDTLLFQQAVIMVDTLVHRADSLMNAVSFEETACPVVVHNPMGFLPVELTIKDTVVPLLRNDDSRQSVKISSEECSCSGGKIWSFVLAPDIGPVETFVSICPMLVGFSYSETRRLISWSFPTSIRNEKRSEVRLPEITIRQNAKSVECSFGNGARPVSVEMFTMTGKSVMRFANIESGQAIGNVGLVPSGFYVLKAKTTSGSVTKGIWLGR